MSAKSDKYEKDVAAYINGIAGVNADRPPVGTGYPDILIEYKNQKSWLEVKMNHTDNLANPRVFYDGKWKTTYNTPVAAAVVDALNKSEQTTKFIKSLSKFTGIPFSDIKLPTTKGEYNRLQGHGAVPIKIMKAYFAQPNVNRYIFSKENVNLGEMVTEHYTKGKTKPAYYMQAADDFYMISRENPFKLSNDIPLLVGNGDFKVRVSTRTEFYEIQPEIKIKQMPKSTYSLQPGTKKKNPFLR